MFTLLTSCKNKGSGSYENKDNAAMTETVEHPGKILMEQKCNSCHSPESSMELRLAPPMIAVKSHYLIDGMTREEFAASIWKWVKKPNPENTKMKGAVKRFGVMPYLPHEKKEIIAIANYMYDNEIEEPAWFKEHQEQMGEDRKHNGNTSKEAEQNAAQTKTAKDRGLEYATNTKVALGKELMSAIQTKGTKGAVTFCNVQAYPITDSMAVAQNATIKRVSDKPRNPANKANKKELQIVAQFKKFIANNETYEPVTTVENEKTQFYYPITTNAMCLQCHGIPQKDIKSDVLTTINGLYPADLATGYKENQLRGIWSITFNN